MANERIHTIRDSAFRLLGDQPHIAEDDPLGFDRFADDLMRLILTSRRSSPFTLGVEGGWGVGKSSLMLQIAERLDDRNDVRTVWFNAWSAEDGTALEGLIKSVLEELEPNVLRRAMRKENLIGVLGILGSLAAAWLGLGTLVDQAWRRMSIDPKTRNKMGDVMRRAMDDWRTKGGSASADRLLVVFVDDLDRCSPTNVFQIFEAIKLYLDAPGLVFVVGFDHGIVSEAILQQQHYSRAVTSESYLEKIVQITFRVPTPGDEEVRQLIDTYAAASRTSELFPEPARTLVIERNQRNPRRIKRFINRFVLEYDLDPEWATVGPEALARVLILRMYFPAFGRLLDAGGHDDPVDEFLDYAHADAILRGPKPQADEDEWAWLIRMLATHGIAVLDDDPRAPAELLEELERTLPEGFRDLVRDAEFRSLVDGLGDTDARMRLRDKLQRTRTIVSLGGSEPSVEPGVFGVEARRTLLGKRILWLNDRPATVARLAEQFTGLGAHVVMARDDEEAERSIAEIELLISDIGRGSEKSAGFDGLARLREEQTYNGPAVFYSSFVTGARRQQARALRAEIVSDASELVPVAVNLLREAGQSRPPSGKGGRIFLSYRREDAPGHAGRLQDALNERLGADRVFLDINIRPGLDFVDTIRAQIENADVFIAMIGPRWLTAADTDGRRRIDQTDDFVRLELAEAMAAGTVVIPVLVGGAKMPASSELPSDIAGLASLQAVELRDTSWRQDAETLVEALVTARSD